MNPKIAELFSPFQDRIRTFSLNDVMYVVWGLAGNLQFDKPIPGGIQTRKEFVQDADITQRRVAGINEWELEFILAQALIHSPSLILTGYSLKELRHIGPLVNDLRKFENEVHKLLFKDPSLIQREFFRIAHRQFPWQVPMTTQSTYRYFRIFNDHDLRPIVEKAIRLTPLEIYQIGLMFLGLFNNNFSALLPVKIPAGFVDEGKTGIFIYTFGTDLATIQRQLRSSIPMDETMVYAYNPLRAKPILIQGDRIYCPFPTLLLWQMTSGVYYHIVSTVGFNHAFGNAFQNYVGFIINEVLQTNGTFIIYPEATYGRPEKRSIDWVIEDDDGYLMIECKSKRLTVSSKSEILEILAVESDLDKMCSFIVQGYKTIVDFRAGRYPHINYDVSKQINLVVLTLEEWFIMFSPEYADMLRLKVITKLKEDGIDDNLVNEIPYFIESMDTFERNIQLIESIGTVRFAEAMKVNTLEQLLEKFKLKDLLTKYFDSEILGPLKH